MSNHLAVATTTEALRRLLQAAIGSTQLAGAVATTGRPSGNGVAGDVPDLGVNAYLYQVSPNVAWRNADLPTRDGTGSLRQRPQVALDLHYLLTFHGDDAQAEPQRLLGGVVSALHTRAVLSREGLRRIVADAGDPDNPNPPHPYLASSDLAEQAALVRFTPLALNLEELSKLWSVFFQTRYVLSLAYQASVVLIEADEAARAALPVRRRGVTVVPFRRPLIDEVVPQIVEPGAVLTLRGRNLAAAAAVVVFDGATEVAPLALRDAELEVAVPATVPAGIRTVAVRHDVDLATPHEPHRGLASNLVAFALAPVITTPLPLEPVARGDVLRLDLRPSLERTQAVRLLLGDRVIPIRRDATVPDRSGHAEFTIPHDVPAADGYLLRVEVDGVPSALQVDEDDHSPTVGRYVGPLVTIT
jgi:hypothetical protein